MKYKCQNCGYEFITKNPFARCPKCDSNAKKFLGAGK
jgi:rubrerythrin